MAQGLDPSVANWVGFLPARIEIARNSTPQASITCLRPRLRYFAAEITSEGNCVPQ